jgi:hypothetical protein
VVGSVIGGLSFRSLCAPSYASSGWFPVHPTA